MKFNYSFLSDELALIEIRKHKWIESQKLRREIGFATAAVDWVNQYGEQWRQFRLGLADTNNVFKEKRMHRRFNDQLPISLNIGGQKIKSQTKDFNIVGLSCFVPYKVPRNTETKISIDFVSRRSKRKKTKFNFVSRISRVSSNDTNELSKDYHIFLPFTEDIRDHLRVNAKG